jgi:hypothetical protein
MKAQALQHIFIGFLLVLFGAVAPFLIVLEIFANYFWLNLLAYSASVIGLFIGVFGAFQLGQEEMDK